MRASRLKWLLVPALFVGGFAAAGGSGAGFCCLDGTGTNARFDVVTFVVTLAGSGFDSVRREEVRFTGTIAGLAQSKSTGTGSEVHYVFRPDITGKGATTGTEHKLRGAADGWLTSFDGFSSTACVTFRDSAGGELGVAIDLLFKNNEFGGARAQIDPALCP